RRRCRRGWCPGTRAPRSASRRWRRSRDAFGRRCFGGGPARSRRSPGASRSVNLQSRRENKQTHFHDLQPNSPWVRMPIPPAARAGWQVEGSAVDRFRRPAEGTWTGHYPELGTAPISFEDSTSPAFYELEREAIFKRAWLYAGRMEDLPRNGSYFT